MDTASKKIEAYFKPYRLKTFFKGELIVFPDDTVPPISYLIEGRVGQYDIAESGNKNMLTIYKPGSFFPMSCAVNNTPNKYFFEALETVKVRQAPAVEVVAFAQQEPVVLFDLLQRLYRGMDGLLGRMSLLMTGSAEHRLLYELLLVADRFGERQDDGSRRLKITESQLASQTGLARETISRELQKLSRRGTVKLAQGEIFIKP
jgi:CRP/FNR family transcriptional regulator